MCFFRITNLFARLIFVILTLMACACQQSAPQKEIAVHTAVPKATNTQPPPTSTPPPATNTPVPSLEPTATPTPTNTAATTVSIPLGASPTIDGTLASDEWVDGAVAMLSDESELFLKHDANYLYLAIRSLTPEMIGANVFIERGEEVMVLHTSAALGTAVYLPQNNTWQQTQAFDWKCRSTSSSATAQAERADYLEENQWLAANSRMGHPNQLEYQIQLPDKPLRMAVTIFRSSNVDARPYWPPTLNDDLIQPAPDGLGTQLNLSLEQWAGLEMVVGE